jgi:hemoglobin
MKHIKLLAIASALAIGFSAGLAAEAEDSGASLYQRLGAKPAIEAVVDDLVDRILGDTRVNAWFAHAAGNPRAAAAYKQKLVDFVCQATGGPCKYTGMDMSAAHRDRAITAEAFDAVVEDLQATLNKLKVPAKEQAQLLALLGPLKAAVVTRSKPDQGGQR